jgi:predicted permease
MKWGNELGVMLPLDLAAIGYALAASALAGVVFGLAPAWLASETNVNDVLKQGARGATGGRSVSRWQHSLIVAEVALALVLLSGAGLVLRGLQRFASRDPGWRVDGLTVGYVNLPEIKYGAVTRRFAFAEQLQEKLRALPGIEGVALAWYLPIRGFDVSSSFVVEGRPEPPKGHEPIHLNNVVMPGYFKTLGMGLVTGRDFASADTTNRPAVVIINEAMARAFWPGESPLGKRIGGTADWQEIVGVVSDVRFPGEIDEPMTRFQTYTPFAQWTPGGLAIALRGKVSTETLRRAVSELDPDLPVNDAGLASVAVAQSQSEYAVTGWLLDGFATLGLLLAALGIYGVIAGFVAQRTNEIGVRMALGAQLGDVLWLVLGKGLRLTALGVGIGFLGAWAVARLLASVSPELEAKSPLTFVCVAALLVAVAMFACWLPARRAARVDPMVALRSE